MRERLPRLRERQQLRERVPGPLEELLGVRRVEGDRHLQAGAIAERRIGERHGRRQSVGRRSRPRHVRRSRVRDGHQPDGAEATQGLGPHPGGLVVRAERAGHGGRAADDDDDDLALDVEAREVVEAGFGHLQPVAREHERGVHARGGIDPQAEDGLLAEDDRRRLAVPHQREARLVLEQAPRLEGHRLQVAARSPRSEPCGLELRRDVLGGLPVLRTPRLPTAHLVVGQQLDVARTSARPRDRSRSRWTPVSGLCADAPMSTHTATVAQEDSLPERASTHA